MRDVRQCHRRDAVGGLWALDVGAVAYMAIALFVCTVGGCSNVDIASIGVSGRMETTKDGLQ